MADAQSAYTKSVQAFDAVAAAANQPSFTDTAAQLAAANTSLASANAALASMTADRDAQKTRADTAETRFANLNAKIDAAQAGA